MEKQTLNVVSSLIAFDAIPKAKKDESMKDYVQRAYPEFEKAVENSSNPIIQEVKSDSEKDLHNAISKLEARIMLTRRYCQVNDPFLLEPPKEATVEEILEHNGIAGSPDDLRKIMGDEPFEKYIQSLRTPKKDGLTPTKIREEEEKHYAKHEPLYPCIKEFTHNNGGTTRGYHWQSSLKDVFIQDHERFLNEYGVTDTFVKVEEPEAEEPENDEAETKSKGKGKAKSKK
jgi:hypothetical protein